METISAALIMLGLFITVLAKIWLVCYAYDDGCLWVIIVLLLPFGELLYILLYWQDAKKPFYLWLVGFLIALVGVLLSPEIQSTT